MKMIIKKYGAFALLGLVFFFLVFLNLFFHDHWLDSDMAAEMVFSRLLAESGHLFATPEWYYSTEFRVLYTQLVMTPLFLVTDNWHFIRVTTNIVTYLLMMASYFYMMKPLKVDRRLTALTGAVLLLPFSETMMTHMQMGNTYMPHVILLCLFFGMFLRLVKKEGYSRGRRWEITGFYAGLAVICGVSGVRYLLAMQCPLLLASVLYLCGSREFGLFRSRFGGGGDTGAYWKDVWKSAEARYVYYSLLGAAAGVAGYGLNVLWVSRRYVFQTYGATNFIAVYQGVLGERLQNAIGSLLMLFGYIPDKGFLSVRGLISLVSFVLIALLGYCCVRVYRKNKGERFFVALFLGVAFGLNVFVFVFTTSTMVPRYYITLLLFALPVLAFYFEGQELPFDRAVAGILLGVCLCAASGKVALSYLGADKNADRRDVAAFLEENGFDFGYATYWNANIITELTDGAVEVANIHDLGTLEYFKWSSPVKYYSEDYHQGRTFLLLTGEEAAQYRGTPALRGGELVYEDGKYTVYAYRSTAQFLSNAP